RFIATVLLICGFCHGLSVAAGRSAGVDCGIREKPASEAVMLEQYVKKILTSRVYDVAVETPLQPARQLSERTGNQILLKREDRQPVYSFKMRGAYNKLSHLTAEQLAGGVFTASAGNHSPGLALTAKHMRGKANIGMTKTPP